MMKIPSFLIQQSPLHDRMIFKVESWDLGGIFGQLKLSGRYMLSDQVLQLSAKMMK